MLLVRERAKHHHSEGNAVYVDAILVTDGREFLKNAGVWVAAVSAAHEIEHPVEGVAKVYLNPFPLLYLVKVDHDVWGAADVDFVAAVVAGVLGVVGEEGALASSDVPHAQQVQLPDCPVQYRHLW